MKKTETADDVERKAEVRVVRFPDAWAREKATPAWLLAAARAFAAACREPFDSVRMTETDFDHAIDRVR